MVTDGYTHLVDGHGQKIDRKRMYDQQKCDFRNHNKAKTILLSAISYSKYEKISNRETVKNMFDSMRMTHEGNYDTVGELTFAFYHKYVDS